MRLWVNPSVTVLFKWENGTVRSVAALELVLGCPLLVVNNSHREDTGRLDCEFKWTSCIFIYQAYPLKKFCIYVENIIWTLGVTLINLQWKGELLKKNKKIDRLFYWLNYNKSFQMNILQISCIHWCSHREQLEGAWVGLKIWSLAMGEWVPVAWTLN